VCGQLAKIRPQKNHWSESRGSMWHPKQFWVESRGVQGTAQNKFGQFLTFIKKNPLVREPWFNVAPKTVLVESRGSRGCPKLFWAVFDQTQKNPDSGFNSENQTWTKTND
jgi:hypothetical protein